MSKKNLLYVFADHWRGDAIGYAKADPVKTPNMDECNTWGDYFYLETLTRVSMDWKPYW